MEFFHYRLSSHMTRKPKRTKLKKGRAAHHKLSSSNQPTPQGKQYAPPPPPPPQTQPPEHDCHLTAVFLREELMFRGHLGIGTSAPWKEVSFSGGIKYKGYMGTFFSTGTNVCLWNGGFPWIGVSKESLQPCATEQSLVAGCPAVKLCF